jgi:hypothetical protein
MTSSKHPKGPEDRKQGLGADTPRPADDLGRNPGIGSSKGVFSRTGANPEELEADNTAEGDVMNDTTAQGGVNPNQQGRTNR